MKSAALTIGLGAVAIIAAGVALNFLSTIDATRKFAEYAQRGFRG